VALRALEALPDKGDKLRHFLFERSTFLIHWQAQRCDAIACVNIAVAAIQIVMAQQQPQQRALRSATKPSPRASRHAKHSVSYREPSSESETEVDEEDDDDLDENTTVKKQPKRHWPTPRSTPNKRRRQASKSPSHSKKSPPGRERGNLDVEKHRELSLPRVKL
jgi:hypothetical protein